MFCCIRTYSFIKFSFIKFKWDRFNVKFYGPVSGQSEDDTAFIEEADEGEVFLYRYSETDNGEPVLDNIESDEEYDIVSDAFDEFLDSQEFDELVDADDEE